MQPSHGLEERRARRSQMMTCAHCGDVIGVYERLVAVDGPELRETSLAADPEFARDASACYHHGCFASLQPGHTLWEAER